MLSKQDFDLTITANEDVKTLGNMNSAEGISEMEILQNVADVSLL
jgi:hypothetical protein